MKTRGRDARATVRTDLTACPSPRIVCRVNPTMNKPLIRTARPADADTIADFNVRMAKETESIDLNPATVGRGVRAALADPHKAIYFVAEVAGRVVAQLMITHE